MRINELILEFVSPKSNNVTDDIKYLLQNAPIPLTVLAKGLEVLKKDTIARQAQEKTPPVHTPPHQQAVSGQPNVHPEQPDSDEEPELNERVSTASKKPKTSALGPSSLDGSSLSNEILDQLSSGNHDEETLKRVRYAFELSSFNKMSDEIIDKKISVKTASIKEGMKTAISSLADSIPVKIMIDFLKDCESGGVINTPEMVKNSTSKALPIPITKSEYLPIVLRLFTAQAVGASATGKGEFGLAFAGIGASKGMHDITVDSGNGPIDVEVKASRGSTDFFFKGQTGFGTSGKFGAGTKVALEKLITALNEVGGEFKKSNEVGKGGIAQINPKTLSVINPFFAKLKKQRVQRLLCDIIQDNHPDLNISEYFSSIEDSVSENGTVNYSKLVQAASGISFYYYQTIENHPGVLMLNITNGTYMYQNNGLDFSKAVASGDIGPTSAIDFRTSSKGSLTFRLK
jgi:hypothetical protein